MPKVDRRKWDARHRQRGFFPEHPCPLIADRSRFLPPGGAALDVAGGTGRHALWLAQRGFRTTLADISPVALEIAASEAQRRGLPLTTLLVDLESHPFPSGPWDVLVCCHYLHRPLFASFAHNLSAHGVLLFAQPTRSNLERHSRPPRLFLLEDGELPGLAESSGLQILDYREGWLGDRHEAVLAAGRAKVK